MPEYGKPIENNLHFKSLVDFFKDEPSDDSEESKSVVVPSVVQPPHDYTAGVASVATLLGLDVLLVGYIILSIPLLSLQDSLT